jgi:hypothetical protein
LSEDELRAQLEAELRRTQYADLVNVVDALPRATEQWWKTYSLWSFTDHGPGHSKRVAAYALRLADIAPVAQALRLNFLERFVLWAAAWVHDLGMQKATQSEDANEIRETHPLRTRKAIQDGKFKIGMADPQVLNLISIVANAHGTQYYRAVVDAEGATVHVRGQRVRVGLLAALLLMADELDLNTERALDDDAAAEFDVPDTAAHWLKHQCVSHVDFVHSDAGVHITVEMLYARQLIWSDRVAIEQWIRDKLQRQIAMIDQEIVAGFSGMMQFDPNIEFLRHEHDFPQKYAKGDVMAVIHRENAKSTLINHVDCLTKSVDTLRANKSVLLLGGGATNEPVIDGRDDLFDAVLANAAASSAVTASVYRAESDVMLTASDVLHAIVSELDDEYDHDVPDEHENDRRERLLGKLTARVREGEGSIVLGLPGWEKLPPSQASWLAEVVIVPLSDDPDLSWVISSTSDRAPAGANDGWQHVTVGDTPTEALRQWVVAHVGRLSSYANVWSSYAMAKQITFENESERAAAR